MAMVLHRLVKKFFVLCSLVIVLSIGGVGWYVHHFLETPGPALRQPISVLVPKGASLRTVALALEEQGVVTNGTLFSWWVRYTGADRKIKTGEYEFDEALTPVELLRRLLLGEGLRVSVTIPEGWTFQQIVKLLSEKGLGSEENFLCLNTDPVFLEKWGLPWQGIEGYLFPDTYYFSRFASAEEVLGQMIGHFYKMLKPEMYRRAEALDLSVHEVVTLASLIEKETGTPQERPLVSAVFHNRLKKGIPLQCDPTVIYGIPDFDGNLTRAHLRTPTLYNTYVIRGLPPGPIANPGLKSLQAALQPADGDYLYFVAKGDGSHLFSSDLATHNRAVMQYQKRRRS
jgi:UPF0755 protein